MIVSKQVGLCRAVERVLAADPELSGCGVVDVFLDDAAGLPTRERQNAQTKIRVMISAAGHARKPGTGASTAGDASLSIAVLENPSRRQVGQVTLTGVSERIAGALHWMEYDGARIRYLDMARTDAAPDERRMDIRFAVTVPLDERRAVRWGTGASIILGEVTQIRRGRGGTNVYEQDRRGNDRWTGTRNRHWTVSLTATVDAGIGEDDLPELGETFTVGGKTFVTDGAELVESGEDTASVSLTGRTLEFDN